MRRPRRFHAFCVGLPRSGTTSIEAIFGHYRSGKKPVLEGPEAWAEIRRILEGKDADRRIRDYIRRQDSSAYLEMNASPANHLYLKTLIEEFPDAKFIFTVRDCYSWCRSAIDSWLHALERNPSTVVGHIPIGIDGALIKDEKDLVDRFDIAIEGVLSVWARNADIARALPPDRTLIVRTRDISCNLGALAEFVGAVPGSLISIFSHSKRNGRRYDFDRALDSRFLKKVFERHASSSLMKTYFPQATLEDFFSRHSKPGSIGDWVTTSRESSLRNPLLDSLQRDVAARADSDSFDRDFPINYWIHLAEAALAAGRREQADRYLARAEALRPEPDEWFRIGALRQALGQSRKVMGILLKATVLSSGRAEPWALYADAAVSCGRRQAAVKALARAAALKPSSDELLRMASVYLRLQMPGPALKILRGMTRHDPRKIEAWILEADAAAACRLWGLAASSLVRAEKLGPSRSQLDRIAILCRRVKDGDRRKSGV